MAEVVQRQWDGDDPNQSMSSQLRDVLAVLEQLDTFENFVTASTADVEGNPGIRVQVLNERDAEKEGLIQRLAEITELPTIVSVMPRAGD